MSPQLKVLGITVCQHKYKSTAFYDIVERVENILAEWKSKVLLNAGRATLIKSTAQSIPTYAMQTYMLPTSTCRKLDTCIKDFWWGFNKDEGRHLYLKSWQSICAPKEVRSLGFRRMRDCNEAFNTKLAWKFTTSKDKLWTKCDTLNI